MKNEFKTHDFQSFAVITATKKFRLLRLEKVSDKKFDFVFFDPNHEIEKIIKKHWNSELLLPTKNLIDAISEGKTRIYSGI